MAESARTPTPSTGVPTPVFDMASDLFVAQFQRPAHIQPVNMRALSPFQRALLVIDGTVTTFLEAYTLEPIEVDLVGQALQNLSEPNSWLDLAAGERVVARQVTLTGRYSRRLYANATSLIAVDRLPEDIVAGLDAIGGGLGRILNSARSENRREILWYGREKGDEGKAPGESFIVRTYRIIQEGHPVMLISERFPSGDPDQPAHD